MKRAGDGTLNYFSVEQGTTPPPGPAFPAIHLKGGDMHMMEVKTVEVHYDGPNIDAQRLDQPEIAGEFISSWITTMSRQSGIDSDAERFGFLALDGRHRLLGVKVLSIGTSTQCPVDGRKLFKAALFLDASGVILFHNHPSEDLNPSRDDLDLTRRLVMGGHLLGVNVHDHIIVSGARWISLRSTRADVFSG